MTSEIMLTQQTTARRKFGGYKPEKPKVLRNPKVDRTLGNIMDAWGKAQERWDLNLKQRRYDDHYESMLPLVEALGHSAEDVERFVSFLSSLKKGGMAVSPFSLGHFLTALVNTSDDNDFVLDLRFMRQVNCIGDSNRKNVTIIPCDVMCPLGRRMESGMIHLKGDCYDRIAQGMRNGKIIVDGHSRWASDGIAVGMEGGTLVIKGDCENDVGKDMEGGRVIIHGNLATGYDMHRVNSEYSNKRICAGYCMKGGEIYILGKTDAVIGDGMGGGEIHLYDEFDRIGDVQRGKIFHRGKLIVHK